MGRFVEKEWSFFASTNVIAEGSSIIVGRSRYEEDEGYDAVVEFRNAYFFTERTKISPQTLIETWWSKGPIVITTTNPPQEISIQTPEGIPWRYGFLYEATRIESA